MVLAGLPVCSGARELKSRVTGTELTTSSHMRVAGRARLTVAHRPTVITSLYKVLC